MACFFGHKWNGCTCSKCGKKRETGHEFRPVDGKCENKCEICGKITTFPCNFKAVKGQCLERCERCGKEREKHDYENGYCKNCGKMSDTPFNLSCLTMEEVNALDKALEIGKKANTQKELDPFYTSAKTQLSSRRQGIIELVITGLTAVAVNQALIQNVQDFMKTNPNEFLARVSMAGNLKTAVDKMSDLINKFNEEAKKHNQEAPKVSLDKASLDKVILDKNKIKK